MGTLAAFIKLTDDDGRIGKHISGMFIWRAEPLLHDDDVLTYNVSRKPPADIDWEVVEEMTLIGGDNIQHTYPTEPIYQFKHKYSDGAELCIARAILALQEKGMNL